MQAPCNSCLIKGPIKIENVNLTYVVAKVFGHKEKSQNVKFEKLWLAKGCHKQRCKTVRHFLIIDLKNFFEIPQNWIEV